MEGEINNFLLVWSVVLASLCYCHSAGRHFPTGKIVRPVAIIPVACLFFLLPFNLSSVYLGGTTTFFIAWLANFKILLFAFGFGPLISSPPLPLSRFLALACLPIKFQHFPDTPSNSKAVVSSKSKAEIGKKAHKAITNYVFKIFVLVVCVHMCRYRLPKLFSMLLYCLILYLPLELLLAVVAALTRSFMRVDLEPQFDEPYLATSLQDFWGRRWNLMVSNILRPTVYLPVRNSCSWVVGREFAAVPAVLSTFLVSGLMHELILYIIGRQKPTGEMACFFLVNGFFLALELVVKKFVKGRCCLPRMVSTPLTLLFMLLTSSWLFFPPVVRSKGDVKGCTETLAIIESLKSGRLVRPVDMYCEL